ncbi:proline--tRNA ligase [Kocuria palustris]|nr:proline--tRNA ligase [Kocuria palustris]
MLLEQSLAALSLSTVNENGLPTKTVVFKPKTAKTATPIPIVVFRLESTTAPTGAIAAAAKAKEPRTASDDLIADFFGTTKEEFSLASLSLKNVDEKKIVLLIDANFKDTDIVELATASSKVAVPFKTLKEWIEASKFEYEVVDFSATVAPAPKKSVKAEKESAKLEDAKLIGITVDKLKDFSNWYSQVCVKGEMLDYYDVSGCYILRPNSYYVWETIQDWFNQHIRKMGVKNAYFPMFVSQKVLEKEKDHIEGFAPEVAWVTKAGSSELEEHIAIRPTSETVMYPYYAKWVQSHRDLPLKLNQWNSVVRWEFKHPQPFLRTREFLWQEGHTAHLTQPEATEEVEQILELYKRIYEELLAVPVIPGRKTENEKFAGGDYTTTVEGFIAATGRGIQGATSHHLGQNFSKMFELLVESPEGGNKPRMYAYQNSWGLSTRVIGVMIMTHSDNKGLVLPPRVAQHQVVVIPVGITAKSTPEQKASINEAAKNIESRLDGAGVRVTGDYRENYTSGWKFADAELKGIPLRVEFGPKDAEKQVCTVVRRDTGSKTTVSLANLEDEIKQILDTMQKELLERARKSFDEHRVVVTEWKDFVPTLNAKNVIVAPWCGDASCEDDIKDSSARKDNGEEEEVDEKAPSMGAKSLCIPYDQPKLNEGQKCVKCDKVATTYCMFGRSY